MPDPNAALFAAVSFAARAHQGQVRKDGRTPYAAHVMRVCLVVRHVFGIDDVDVLTAALLHDTIEDTTVDYDDLAEAFGATVAGYAATLSKDTRLPHDEREAAYRAALAAAPWQVQAVKLADLFDNLGDAGNLHPDKRADTVKKCRATLAAFGARVPAELAGARSAVEARLTEAESRPGRVAAADAARE